MGEDGLDIQDLLLEPDIGDQAVFVAADVEHHQVADTVNAVESGLEFGPVGKSVLLDHPPPALQWGFGLRMVGREGPQCAVADDFHPKNLSQFEMALHWSQDRHLI